MKEERLMGFALRFRPTYALRTGTRPISSRICCDRLRGATQAPILFPLDFGCPTGCYLIAAWAVWCFDAAQSS
jgi:hypothetical protein